MQFRVMEELDKGDREDDGIRSRLHGGYSSEIHPESLKILPAYYPLLSAYGPGCVETRASAMILLLNRRGLGWRDLLKG